MGPDHGLVIVIGCSLRGGQDLHIGTKLKIPVHLVIENERRRYAIGDRVRPSDLSRDRSEGRMRRAFPVPGSTKNLAPLRPIIEADRGRMVSHETATISDEFFDDPPSFIRSDVGPLVAPLGVSISKHPPTQSIDDQHINVL